MAKDSLTAAHNNKNDEFYTRMEDKNTLILKSGYFYA